LNEEALMALHAELTREVRTGPSGPKVGAFFDVDRTLWAGFSAFAFFRERLLSGRMAPRELADTLRGALSFALGRQGFSGLMAAAAAGYRGMAESVLEETGERVFVKRLAAEIYPEARALVRAHQEVGHTVAIVTSATRYQVQSLATDLGVAHVLCTELEVEDGVFTGRVVRPACFGEGKAEAIRRLAARYDLDLAESWFYTDSRDDLPALEIVGKPRPLNPDERLARIARERAWPVRRFCSRGTPGAAELLRTALVYGSLGPAALAGLSVAAANGSRREALNVTGSLWADLALALAGVSVRVEGEEHLWSHRPAVFVFNHQSAIDMPIMLKLVRRDVTGVAKQELRRNPLFGPMFALAGVAFVDRADTKKAIEALRPAVEALRRGTSLVIAPEGTRSPTPRLGRFKKGAFHIAMQAGVPIVPVVLRNALDALPKSALVVRPATVEVVVLPPIDTSRWTREGLAAEVEALRERYRAELEG
jgi:putative phosphoserine phosphatase/1-acylglycerol-3-phosphate O-acyltransferase